MDCYKIDTKKKRMVYAFNKKIPFVYSNKVEEWSLFFVLIYFASPKKGDIIRIDCRLSEISPDIPIWAKEACRKARIEKIDTEPK